MLRFRRRLPPHLVTALSAWLSRLTTAAVQLIAIRLLVEGLGLEAYAVFALLTGLLGWFLLVDLGVGISLQNHLSEARAHGNDAEGLLQVGRLLALLLLAVAGVLTALLAPLAGTLLLKAFPFLSGSEKGRLFMVTGVLSSTFGISSIVYKIWYAQHKGYLANTLPTVAACLMLGGVWLAQAAPLPLRLPLSVAAFLLPNALLPLLVLLRQLLRGSWSVFDDVQQIRSVLTLILRRACGFWMFSLLAALTLQVDYIVMSQFLNPTDIALYTLINKILGLFFFVYNALLSAIWPMFTELAASKDWPRIWALLRKYLKWGLLGMFALTLSLPWIMPTFFRLLAPTQSLEAPMGLLLLAGAYQIVRVWTDTFAMLLQSMSQLKPFWILVPFQAATSIALQWLLAPSFGLYGILGGLILSFLLTVSWGLPRFAFQTARSMGTPT